MNLKTAKPVFEIEINQQRRINREKFRKLLLHGVDVEWGKSIAAINTDQEDGVTIEFSDGSSASGMMVVGADGANSKTRRLLCPHTGGLVQLPIRFMGVTVKLSPEQIAPLRAVDPMLFQGTYPDTGSFVWYSLLDTPEVNGSGGTASPYYACQLNLSWLVHGPDDEVPPESIDRVAMLKRLAGPFAEPFRSAFLNIDDGEQVTEIKLSDWSLMEWPNHDGRVTLMGDAAHAMVMCKLKLFGAVLGESSKADRTEPDRGEAANHGITDAQLFKDQMVRLWKSASTDAPLHVARVVGEYEVGMKKRAQWSVFKSRGACFEAHDLAKIQPGADMFASNPSHEVEILRGVTAAVESGV